MGLNTEAPPQLMATCTPNSQPFFTHDGTPQCEHGYQINVLDVELNILATIDLPEWESFRPASAGHRLIEHGYMIRPDARNAETVNGWRPVGSGWVVPVMPNPYREEAEVQPTEAGATADTDLNGLVWHSLVYQPGNELDGLTGPDTNTRCESPRHKFGEFKPPAEWLELLWYPGGDKTVARAWKTCEACHVGMAQSAEKTADAE